MKHLICALALAASAAALLAPSAASAQGMPGGTPPTGTPPTGDLPTNPDTPTPTATLLGSTVTITQYYPDLATAGLSTSVTASTAVEVACPDSSQTLCDASYGLLDGEWLDIAATSISGQLLASFYSDSSVSFNGLVFSDLDFGVDGMAITGLTLTTNMTDLALDRISFTADSLSINLMGLDPSLTSDGSGVGSFTIDFVVSSVPEPVSSALLLAGLGGLGLWRRARAAH